MKSDKNRVEIDGKRSFNQEAQSGLTYAIVVIATGVDENHYPTDFIAISKTIIINSGPPRSSITAPMALCIHLSSSQFPKLWILVLRAPHKNPRKIFMGNFQVSRNDDTVLLMAVAGVKICMKLITC